jgi:hypothetical protein
MRLGGAGISAENRLLEPDTCNRVVGKVTMNVIVVYCAISGAPFPFLSENLCL